MRFCKLVKFLGYIMDWSDFRFWNWIILNFSGLTFDGNNITYIYDDLQTVIHGEFYNGTLIAGKSTKIKAYRCKNGVLEIKLAKKLSAQTYHFKPINEKIDEQRATQMDPMEKNQIYISESQLHNMSLSDGVFAKKKILGNSILIRCYYQRLAYSLFSEIDFHINQERTYSE